MDQKPNVTLKSFVVPLYYCHKRKKMFILVLCVAIKRTDHKPTASVLLVFHSNNNPFIEVDSVNMNYFVVFPVTVV